MKNLKKLMPILLVLTLVIGMISPAFAQGTNTNTGDGSITITNAVKEKTYDIYRMFDLTGRDTSNPANTTFDLFAYTINPDWEAFFIGNPAPAGAPYLIERTDENKDNNEYKNLNLLTHDGKTYFINITDKNVGDVAQDALPYAVGLTNNDGTQTAAADGNLVFEDIALGYYLVYPRGASDINPDAPHNPGADHTSLCSLTTTKPNAEIKQKATYPEIKKDADDYSVEIGQTVTFTVTGQVPDTTGFTAYTYKVSDTMTAGLTFNEDVADMEVKFGDTLITVPDTGKATLTYASNGFVMEFDMTKYQDYKGQEITITYKAIVNDAAVCQVTKNDAILVYSNDPNDSTKKTENPPEEVVVYTSEIVVDKVNESNEKLENAKFVLVKKTKEAPYTVKYLDYGTAEPVAADFTGPKTVVGSTITVANPESVPGYALVSAETVELTISDTTQNIVYYWYAPVGEGGVVNPADYPSITMPSVDAPADYATDKPEQYYKYTAADNTTTPPTPASVTWYTLASGETLADAITAGNVTEVTTNASGAAEFNGLEDGTYYLRETAAPEGYNLLDSDVECVVTHTETNTTPPSPVGVTVTKTIKNQSGTELPSTGSIGTKVFYILGGALLIGAAVLLITRRRMTVNQ